MNIYLTEPPDHVIPHVDLAKRFNPSVRTIAVHFAPSDVTPGQVALQVLRSLGKGVNVIGGHTVREGEHVRYAPMWVQAHRISTVAVLNAHRLDAKVITMLTRAVAPADNLVFVCEPGHLEQATHRIRAAGLTPTHMPWDPWLADHPRLPDPKETEPVPTYTLDHLPNVDFLLFRHRCSTLNTPERFAAIDEDYRRVYRAARSIDPTLHGVIGHLDNVTRTATSTAQMLVAVRATQASLFARGTLARAHPDMLLGTLSCIRPPRPTTADWAALRVYIRPERSATVALYLLGTPTGALRLVTMNEVETALKAGSTNGQPIPNEAVPLIQTQWLRRESEGATPDDRFLDLRGERRHLEILIDARRDLGLPIDGRKLRDDLTSHATRPLYRFGLSIQDLT